MYRRTQTARNVDVGCCALGRARTCSREQSGRHSTRASKQFVILEISCAAPSPSSPPDEIILVGHESARSAKHKKRNVEPKQAPSKEMKQTSSLLVLGIVKQAIDALDQRRLVGPVARRELAVQQGLRRRLAGDLKRRRPTDRGLNLQRLAVKLKLERRRESIGAALVPSSAAKFNVQLDRRLFR